MNDMENLRTFADQLWKYMVPKLDSKFASNVSYFRAEVVSNPGNNMLEVQRPVENGTLTLPCVRAMSGAQAGQQVVALVMGSMSNAIIVGDGNLNVPGGGGDAGIANFQAQPDGSLVITMTNGNTFTATPHDPTKQDVLTFDDAPTQGSNNPVKSGGIYTALAGKQDTLTFDDTPTANSSNPVKSGGIYTALDGKADNAFANVKVGSTAISADNNADTLTLVGDGLVNLTGDATNDSVTISVDPNHTHITTQVLDLVNADSYGPSDLVTFDADVAEVPLKNCVVNIEALQAGSGNPSPTNIRPISGREHVKVWRFGKNFFPQADVTFNVGEGNKTVYFPHPLPAGPYTFSADLTSTYSGNCLVHILRPDGTYISGTGTPGSRVSVNFQSASGNKITGIRFYVGSNWETSVANSGVWSNVQVETGSTATAYEASETVVDADLPELVYGGTLDVLTGKLTVTHEYIKPSEYTGSSISDTMVVVFTHIPLGKRGTNYNIVSNVATGAALTAANIARYGYAVSQSISGTSPILSIAASTTAHPTMASLSQALLDADACFAYELETPEVYQLTPQMVTTLAGQNHIWSDAGNITVEYGAFLQALQAEIERLNQQTNQRAKKNVLAGVEESTTATTNYAVGDFLIVKDSLYKVTAAIAAGETITVDTNVQETTIAQQLKALFASV